MKIEFEDLQKIWDTQNSKQIFVLDDQALHSRILLKQKQAGKITHLSEVIIIFTNVFSGLLVFWLTLSARQSNVYMFLLSLWMILSAFYTYTLRRKRQAGENVFNRTLAGDLERAVSITAYQVRFSRAMLWNILPVAGFILLGLSTSDKPMWIIVLTVVLFGIMNLGGIWEHGFYRRRNKELKSLLVKLRQE